MRVLNLYAGIGGNRKLWTDVEVVAVEMDEKIANIYQDFFPDDLVILGDAHQFLLDHYMNFDFIWSSPPCPTHSKTNHFLHAQGTTRYPDMGLWQEIVFLKTFCHGKWVVENVKPYYEPFWPATVIDRHYFWSNFLITDWRSKEKGFNIANAKTSTRLDPDGYEKSLEEYHGITVPSDVGSTDKRKMLRNCVYPPLGQHILDCARGNTQQTLV